VVWPHVVFLLLGVGGCRARVVPQPPPVAVAPDPFSFLTPELARAAGKTAVFSLKGDAAARHRLETRVAQAMKTRGVQAYEGSGRFKSEHEYSADLLATLLIKGGYQSIAEISYSGPPSKDTAPQNLHITLTHLKNARQGGYPLTQTGFDSALRILIDSLDREKVRRPLIQGRGGP
jgi:hypothetical protein